MPTSRLPRSASRPSARAPPRVAQSTTCSARSELGDRLALGVRLQVLPGAVGAQRGAHGREQVAAPPHAGVHGQRHRDAVRAQRPGGRVALAGALLALGGHRHRAAAGRDALVGVGGQGGGVHEHAGLVQEAGLVRQPDAVVVGRAPHPGVRGDRHAELAGHLVGGLLRERRVAGDVEGHLEGEQVVGGVDLAAGEGLEVGRRRPLPGALLDVAVGQHVAAGDGAQRVDRCLGVLEGLQPVRPVHAGGDAGVEHSAAASRLPARTSCGRKWRPDSR